MDSYNFWQDFFDTYQSLPDWMKALWLIVPPVFVLGLVALVMRFHIDSKRADHRLIGELIYSIHRDSEDRFHIVAHTSPIGGQPTLLLLDLSGREPHMPPPSHPCRPQPQAAAVARVEDQPRRAPAAETETRVTIAALLATANVARDDVGDPTTF